MLYVVDAFTPDLLRSVEGGHLTTTSPPRRVAEHFYLPCRDSDWKRLEAFWARLDSTTVVSKYWFKRSQRFSYVYSRTQRTVMICGYFHSSYTGHYVPPQPAYLAMPERKQQRQVYRRFVEQDGPTLRARYPLLPSLIDFYDLAKNAAVARDIARHLPGDRLVAVLEIGSGGALLPIALSCLVPHLTYVAIDLPFVIPLGFLMATAFLGSEAVALPGEPERVGWLAFRTSTEPRLASQLFDIAVNVTSFMEMTASQVSKYFDLIASALRPGGYFICVNRDQKVSRFADYPWHVLDCDIVEDGEAAISRFSHDGNIILQRILRKR